MGYHDDVKEGYKQLAGKKGNGENESREESLAWSHVSQDLRENAETGSRFTCLRLEAQGPTKTSTSDCTMDR